MKEEECWNKILLGFNKEEQQLIKLAPILLKCSEEDTSIVGALVYSHFINSDEWKGTFRYTAMVIANIFNKRFGNNLTYIDFYLSNLQFYNSKTKVSSLVETQKVMEEKYNSKVCVNCEKR